MPGKVGFIGVGNMGGPMAMNLLKNDFAVVVYNADPAKITPFTAQGALRADSPTAVANVSQQVFQMARAAGLNNEDHAAIIKVIGQLAGIEVQRSS